MADISSAYNKIGSQYAAERLHTPGKIDRVWGWVHDRAEAANQPESERVLDVGCGIGKTVLSRVADAGMVPVGVDIAESQVQRAEVGVRDANVIQATGMNIPLAESSVDAGMCLHLCRHLPDDSVSAVLAELQRVTREDAPVCVTFGVGEKSSDVVRDWGGFGVSLPVHERERLWCVNAMRSNGFRVCEEREGVAPCGVDGSVLYVFAEAAGVGL